MKPTPSHLHRAPVDPKPPSGKTYAEPKPTGAATPAQINFLERGDYKTGDGEDMRVVRL